MSTPSPVDQVRGQLGELLPRLRRFARVITRNVHDADDLVQVAVPKRIMLDAPVVTKDNVNDKIKAVDDATLAALPVRCANGRDNDWWHEPGAAEKRFL